MKIYLKKLHTLLELSASDAHIPLRPSIILNAFIIPTTQNIVKGIEIIPRFISPVPKRFPRLIKIFSTH